MREDDYAMIAWANQNSGALLVLLTLVYCVTTLAIVIISVRSNKLSERYLQQASQIDTATRRPHCFLRLRFADRDGLPYAFLILQNTGKTAALDVNVDLSPMPTTETIFSDSEIERVPYFLEFPVPSLAPGEELYDSIGFTPELFKRFDPPIFLGKIAYKDIFGNSYEEPAELNFKIMERAVLDLKNAT